METTAIQQYERRGVQLVEQARAIMIVDDTTREIAAEFSANARKLVKVIEDEFKPDIEKAHQLHKGLLDRCKRLTLPLKKAQTIVDGEIRRDYLERERVRMEEERKAMQKAEAERQAMEAAKAREVEERINQGDIEGAEELDDAEVIVNPIVPVAPTQKTTASAAGNITARKDIEVEVQDKRTVLQAVLDEKLPDTLITIDVGAAKRYAKASGRFHMPGFVIRETAIVSGRVK